MPHDGRNPCARRQPLLVGLELDAEPVIEDPQVAVAAAHDRFRHDALHLLRHHADIGLVAAVVAEAIEAEAVVEPAEQRDVVLERNIRPPSTTATTAPAAATTAEPAATAAAETAATAATAAAAEAAAAARAAAPGDPTAAATAAAEALLAAGRLRAGGCTRTRAGKGRVASAAARRARPAAAVARLRPVLRPAIPSRARTVAVSCPVAAAGTVTVASASPAIPAARPVTIACAGTVAVARTGTIAVARTGTIAVARARSVAIACTRTVAVTCARTITAGVEHLPAVLAAEILPRTLAGLDVVPGIFLAHVGIVVFHAVPVRGIVLKVPDIDVVDVAIDVDVVVAPVEASAPEISARGPAPDGISGAEGEPGRHHPGGDIAGRRPVVRRIGRRRPCAVNDRGIVVGHIDRIRRRWLDGDDLLVLLLADHDLLFLGRCQLVVRLSLRAQALHGIHDIGLLGQHRIAELLRPIELRAHHVEDGRRRRQRFQAVVPGLLVDRGLELISLEILVLGRPPVG